jgi:hypothetical protein
MLFYITGGAPQAVPGTACVEANWTACIEVYYSSDFRLELKIGKHMPKFYHLVGERIGVRKRGSIPPRYSTQQK